MIVGTRKMEYSISIVANTLNFPSAPIASHEYVNFRRTSATCGGSCMRQLMADKDSNSNHPKRGMYQITSQFNIGATQPINQCIVQSTFYDAAIVVD